MMSIDKYEDSVVELTISSLGELDVRRAKTIMSSNVKPPKLELSTIYRYHALHCGPVTVTKLFTQSK